MLLTLSSEHSELVLNLTELYEVPGGNLVEGTWHVRGRKTWRSEDSGRCAGWTSYGCTVLQGGASDVGGA